MSVLVLLFLCTDVYIHWRVRTYSVRRQPSVVCVIAKEDLFVKKRVQNLSFSQESVCLLFSTV